MEPICSLAALFACWSGFYIDGGLLYQDSGVEQVRDVSMYRWIPGDQDFQLDSATHESSRVAANPYGRLALGYEMRFPSVTLSIEASHLSSINTGTDRGVNAIGIKARWYMFRR